MKLSVAYAFIGVIASEFILSGSGIGYAIGYAYNNFQNDDMYSLMLLVLVLVTLVNLVLNPSIAVSGAPAALEHADTERFRHEEISRFAAVRWSSSCWQCLHWAVGNSSLSSPWSTVERWSQMLGTAASGAMWAKPRGRWYALVIALAGGVALGVRSA